MGVLFFLIVEMRENSFWWIFILSTDFFLDACVKISI